MQQNRGAPGSRQNFKKRSSKNLKKKNDRSREEEDKEGENESCCDNEENLTVSNLYNLCLLFSREKK